MNKKVAPKNVLSTCKLLGLARDSICFQLKCVRWFLGNFVFEIFCEFVSDFQTWHKGLLRIFLFFFCILYNGLFDLTTNLYKKTFVDNHDQRKKP